MIDFSPVLSVFATALPYLIGFALLGLLLKSAWFKGKVGEFAVSTVISVALNKDTYHLINDVTLMTERGPTQIDHIIVSTYGVFVIETKNYRGWIFGSAHQRQWTQKIYRKSYRFMNPLHQNYKHVKAVTDICGLAAEDVHSVVVFTGSSTFKTPMPNNVVRLSKMIKFLRSFTHQILSAEQVNQSLRKIEDNQRAN